MKNAAGKQLVEYSSSKVGSFGTSWLRESADLNDVDLSGADLGRAVLNDATLQRANLSGANLSGANLACACLNETNLKNTTLTEAIIFQTVLAGVNLTGAIDLEKCRHLGPSVVDFRTLKNRDPLPLVFLRGIGLPDNLIDYLPSLAGQAIQYYSCFISYSSKDDDFARRIHADLQGKCVRCWFAPHDLPIGGKLMDEIDAAVRLRDKLLIVLSEDLIKSGWVEDEVKTAYEEERKRGQKNVLFPIRLDDAVLETKEARAKLRVDRNIGDFRSGRAPIVTRKAWRACCGISLRNHDRTRQSKRRAASFLFSRAGRWACPRKTTALPPAGNQG